MGPTKQEWLRSMQDAELESLYAPIFGAEGDEDDEADEDADGDDGEDEDDDDDDGKDDKSKRNSKSKSKSKSKKDEDEDDDDDSDEDVTYWKDRASRFERRMRAADERANKAEAALRKAKQGKDDALDGPGKVELDEAKTANGKLSKTNNDLRLQLEILSDSTFEWNNPKLVLRALADDPDVEIDEDGKVVGVRRALRRFAKENPYMLKSKASAKKADTEDEDDEDDDEDENAPSKRQVARRRSGGKQGGQSKGKIDQAALRAKYPALNRR